MLNQGTFIPFAYVCLVWLWERAKVDSREADVIAGLQRVFDFSPVLRTVTGPRPVEHPRDVLRLIRNAISHAHLVAENERFVFTDFDPKKKQGPTSLSVTWTELGELSEGLLFAMNAILYPGTSSA